MAANLAKLHPEFQRILKSGSKALRDLKKVDPRDRYVVLYPDSDSAHVGMGFNSLNNSAAEEVFDKASKLSGTDLLKLCLKGPKSDLLGALENKSLASYVTSHATMVNFIDKQPYIYDYCKAAAGVGVGFVNALVFMKAMSFEDGFEFVKKRAQAMDKAASIVPGAKLKIHILPATRKRKICQAAIEHCLKQGISSEIAVCAVTKQTQPHVIEIGGHEEAIRYLESEGSNLFEFKRMKRLPESAKAFHTELMMPASEFLIAYIEDKIRNNPDYLSDLEARSVYSATSGCRLRHVESIKKDLCTSPIKPLKIEQLLHCLYARSQQIAQPNSLVVGDRGLLRNMMFVNRKAWSSAKLLRT